ncbi:MAG: hypothetical protein JKY94_01905 [Rhodobacteraceae bacterium]|nr:hypothetical protein [Paracoccaceae bacterium]
MATRKATAKAPAKEKSAPVKKRPKLKLDRARAALEQGASPHAIIAVLIDELEASNG